MGKMKQTVATRKRDADSSEGDAKRNTASTENIGHEPGDLGFLDRAQAASQPGLCSNRRLSIIIPLILVSATDT